MSLLRKFLCYLGFCPVVYNRAEDPILQKYVRLEHRVNKLWRPRELFDV